jgi:hypothetical protein
MPNRQFKQLPLGSKDWTVIQVSRYRRRIERGRHYNNAYLRPRALETLQKCERKITVKVAFVEFVKDDRVDALESRICQQTAGQNALRNKPESRARPDPLFEADLVADRSAYFFASFPCDPTCRQASRDPARLEHDNFAADEAENGWRNTGGLPGSWRCFNDELGRVPEDCENLRQNRIHRKCWLSNH